MKKSVATANVQPHLIWDHLWSCPRALARFLTYVRSHACEMCAASMSLCTCKQLRRPMLQATPLIILSKCQKWLSSLAASHFQQSSRTKPVIIIQMVLHVWVNWVGLNILYWHCSFHIRLGKTLHVDRTLHCSHNFFYTNNKIKFYPCLNTPHNFMCMCEIATQASQWFRCGGAFIPVSQCVELKTFYST